MKQYLPYVFILMAVMSWGAYVPTIHHGQLGFGEPKGPLRAFLFVGLAYFLVAVCVPGLLILGKAEPAVFPMKGMSVSTMAGVLGALGALGVILALRTGGKPIYVAPLVFAGAPIMNVIVTMIWDRPHRAPAMPFYLGILMAAVGAALVLRYKPA
ncbi:MAG: hypothetical protein DCC65_12055 [Planctomycetota bacterium]|nr:MAG: hypothetical protein DCC65_12055 [Planctomycetota bacterium]